MAAPAPQTDSDDWSLYPYDPVKPLPIIFAVLVAAIGSIIAYQSFAKYKWKYFGAVVVWASSVWVAGFICRAYSQYNVQNIGMFIAQVVLVLTGPPLFAAAVYSVLSRLMHYLPYHAPLHPDRVISTFVFLSAAVESLTASGAANSAGAGPQDTDQRATGLALIKAGLLLQACLEVLFSSMVIIMQVRSSKAGHFNKNIRTVCYVLYITSAMMLLRCIIRVVEAFEASGCDPNAPDYNGYCGYVSQHEWMLWVFEVANITLFLIIFMLFPPGRYLPRDTKIYLDPNDGQTERFGPGFGKAARRMWILTVLDPWNLTGVITGRGHDIIPFWQDDYPVVEQEVHASKVESSI